MSGFFHDSVRNKTQEWYTPSYIFEALGLKFDLDPCSPGKDVVPWIPAFQHYKFVDDGLLLPWFGKVWLNPPYSTQTIRWVKKLSEHKNGVALVFARTDTKWFQDYAALANVMCFIRGRVKFMSSECKSFNSSGAPSVLLGFGNECSNAVSACGLGLILEVKGSEN